MQQKWNQNFDGEPMTDIPQKFLNAGCDVYTVSYTHLEIRKTAESYLAAG